MVPGNDLDPANWNTQVRGDQLAHGLVGATVDRCCGRADHKASGALAADLVAFGARDHADVEPHGFIRISLRRHTAERTASARSATL